MSTSIDNGTTVAELQAECRLLREQVARLQAEITEERQARGRLQAERDLYLQSIYAWSRAQVSEEQRRRWATEQDATGVSFDQLVAELAASNPS